MSITDLLSTDHRSLHASLAELKRCFSAQDLPAAARQLAEFRRSLARHIAVEEKLLFPAFERLTGVRGSGPIEAMRLEHAQILQLLAAIAVSLVGGAPKDRIAQLAELTVRLLAHNGKEDRVLYPMIDGAKSRKIEPRKLARQIEAYFSEGA